LTVLYEHTTNFEKFSISYPNFLDWQRTNSTFASMAAYRHEDFNITGSGEPERVRGGMVSAEFFPILGVEPLLAASSSATRIAWALPPSRSWPKASGNDGLVLPATLSGSKSS
jgi:putative ABC transport system permease protein